jgi:NAD(P)H-hydrate repair Nnr-like enzyme with NAD(P)H-hydrate dehydratase domain
VDAARLAVWAHGLAGERAARGATATDIADLLAAALA